MFFLEQMVIISVIRYKGGVGMFLGNGFFGGAPPIFILISVVILGIIVFRMITGLRQWNSNNHLPVLIVPAQEVAKRTNVTHHNHNNNGNITHTTSTHYFLTLEVESGDRMAFQVHGQEYGMLAEDDFGQLTFQGSRFKGFERGKSMIN